MRQLGSALLLIAILTSGADRKAPDTILAQGSALSSATAAALRVFNAVPQSDCLTSNPSRLNCVALQSSAADVERGIAVFGVGDPDGNGGFIGVMGRTSGGDWKLWFTSLNPYQLTRLPGEMIVCADGDGVSLRSGPSADSDRVDGLPDLARVTGEEFVLTEPVEPGYAGFGWFRIIAPVAGWIYSKYLEAAVLNDRCALRNAQVNRPQPAPVNDGSQAKPRTAETALVGRRRGQP